MPDGNFQEHEADEHNGDDHEIDKHETQEMPSMSIYLEGDKDVLEEITKRTKRIEYIDEDTYTDFAEGVYNLEHVGALNVGSFLECLISYFEVSDGKIGSYLILYIMACGEGLFAKGFDHRSFYKYLTKKMEEFALNYEYILCDSETMVAASIYLVNEFKIVVHPNESLYTQIRDNMDDLRDYLYSGFKYISENISES